MSYKVNTEERIKLAKNDSVDRIYVSKQDQRAVNIFLINASLYLKHFLLIGQSVDSNIVRFNSEPRSGTKKTTRNY